MSLVLDSYSKCLSLCFNPALFSYWWVLCLCNLASILRVNTEHVGAFVIRLFLFCFFLIVLASFLLIFLYLSIDFILFLRFQLLLLFLIIIIITTIFDFSFILIFSWASSKGQKWFHGIFPCRSLLKKKELTNAYIFYRV